MSRSQWPDTPASDASASAGAARDKAAWLAVAAALRRDETVAEPDALLLAAWLDGRLEEAEAAPLERWIAQDPAGAAARIATLRDSLAAEPPAVTNRFLLRLRAMTPQRSPATAPALFLFWRRLPQAAALAAALCLGAFGAYGGYEMGMTAGLAQERSQAAVLQAALSDFDLTQEEFFFE
ncbi:MAG TPA: hypothetical protein VK035_07690 [Kiloniellales bacterium]|nr:hypothetical protein [Kiloniellales bacterium]